MYDIKALYEAESVQDAVRLLQEHPEAQILAGGSDVLVQIREGRRAGKEFVSIYMLDELRGVTIDEEENIRKMIHETIDEKLARVNNGQASRTEIISSVKRALRTMFEKNLQRDPIVEVQVVEI